MKLIEEDTWLQPVANVIIRRHQQYEIRKSVIENEYGSLYQYAGWHNELGFHYDKNKKGWFFRDWLPRAQQVYLIGDFNHWEPCRNPLHRTENGIWEIFLPDIEWKDQLIHNSHIKLNIKSKNGWSQHLPAYILYTYQDPVTKIFNGRFWNPSYAFDWENDTSISISHDELFIYECHIGMAQEKLGVGTFEEFTQFQIPYIKSLGYNALQIMGLAEHPYYGSFGYHVSNFFAPSSRFGTPGELKKLIRTAHQNGLIVIMDVVHAHFVSNILEGLNQLDGEDGLYSREGNEGNHPYWNSKLFDYGKPEVQRFLLSNLRYWMEEFHIDGFRFDGVTSMLYTHHGYIDNFGTYENYFGNQVNEDAITYITLANELIHTLNPDAITIAEEVSGMPGIARPIDEGGMGFDYRMAMAIPDYWIRILKDEADSQWNMEQLWHVITNRIWNVKTVAYCESHDQAMVGDKTLAFQLMDKEMYYGMGVDQDNFVVDRGIALHKMIRFFTLTLGGQAYLNFMGNEFGHPEWIDFPRKENNWSYQHAQRLWSLAIDPKLKYKYLLAFDIAMLSFAKQYHILKAGLVNLMLIDEKNKTIAYESGNLLFVFNWHQENSIPEYKIPITKPGKYHLIFSTDDPQYGGFGRIDPKIEYFSQPFNNEQYLLIYNTNRNGNVFERKE